VKKILVEKYLFIAILRVKMSRLNKALVGWLNLSFIEKIKHDLLKPFFQLA
jgi:hypothetical protein